MSDDRFDILMRSKLGDAQEAVPADLWPAIESKLPAPAVKTKPAIWWKITSGAVAAAAAVLLVVLPGARKHNADPVEIVTDGPAVAMADIPLAESAVTDAQPSHDKAVNNVPASAENRPETDESIPVADNNTDSTENATGGSSDILAVSEMRETEDTADIDNDEWMQSYESGEFVEGGEADSNGTRRRRGFSIAAYADAVSNSNSGQSGDNVIHKSPVSPKSTTIVETGESRYGVPVSAGIGLRFSVTKRFSIGTGVNWTYLTRTFAGQYNKLDSDGMLVSQESYTDIRNTQHYIGIPLSLNFSIISRDFIDFYTYASGTAAYCLQNRYLMEAGEHFTPQGGNWQFSAGIGLGVEFIAAKRVGFYIDPSLNYWWTKGNVTNIRTRQPFTMGLEMGIRFHI